MHFLKFNLWQNIQTHTHKCKARATWAAHAKVFFIVTGNGVYERNILVNTEYCTDISMKYEKTFKYLPIGWRTF